MSATKGGFIKSKWKTIDPDEEKSTKLQKSNESSIFRSVWENEDQTSFINPSPSEDDIDGEYFCFDFHRFIFHVNCCFPKNGNINFLNI